MLIVKSGMRKSICTFAIIWPYYHQTK